MIECYYQLKRPEEAGPLQLRDPEGFVALLLAAAPALLLPATALPVDGRREDDAGTLLRRRQLLHGAVDPPGDRGEAAVRAKRRPAVGEEKAERVVDLGLRAHRRAGVSDSVLLLERDRWRNRFDRVDVGPVEPLQELPRIG